MSNLSDFRFTLEEYTGKEPKVEIPDGVSCIKYEAFAGNKTMEEVSIPETVTMIQRQAFAGCDNLKNVNFSANIPYMCIEEWAFCSCQQLTSIVLPKTLGVVENHTFLGCTHLRNVVLQEGVSRIDEEAFCGCYDLESLTLPEDISYISSSAFSGCDHIKNIFIPGGKDTKTFRELKNSGFDFRTTTVVDCAIAQNQSYQGYKFVVSQHDFFGQNSINFSMPDGIKVLYADHHMNVPEMLQQANFEKKEGNIWEKTSELTSPDDFGGGYRVLVAPVKEIPKDADIIVNANGFCSWLACVRDYRDIQKRSYDDLLQVAKVSKDFDNLHVPQNLSEKSVKQETMDFSF